MDQIRVIIADDHTLVRQGIIRLLEDAGDIQVVADTDNGIDVIELTQEHQPDVVVLDVSMPRLTGLETITRLKRLENPPEVVMLSMYGVDTIARQALHKGARGFVMKRAVAAELLAAIRAANQGAIYLSAGVSQAVGLEVPDDYPDNPLEHLSPREREVVQMVCEGKSSREIAEIQGVSPTTIDKQRRSAMRKLGVTDVVGLVRVSIQHGLVVVDED